ncbi:MAG: oligosaccharide flippase family protein [Ardenticatenia bacterium]|nr:oligosaccharide flippase family protein [Ardenticatenia bacterium]
MAFVRGCTSRAFSALAFILLARHLSVRTFGQYIAVWALLRIFSVLLSLGLDPWILYTCGAIRRQDQHKLIVAWTTAVCVKGGMGILWMSVIWIISLIWEHNIFTPQVMVWGALAVWFEELLSLVWTFFKATLRNHMTFLTMAGFQVAILGTYLGAIWQGVQTVEAFFFVRASTTGIVALLLLVWIAYREGFHLVPQAIWSSVRSALPFGLSMFLSLIYGRADITIVATLLGREAAGLYGPAVSLLTTLLLVPMSVYSVTMPFLSGVYRETPDGFSGKVLRSLWWYSALGISLMVVTVWIAQPLVQLLYGQSYQITSWLLRLLSPIFFFRSLTLALSSALVAVGYQKLRVRVQFLVALLNVIGNFLVIPRFHLAGVALLYVISEALLVAGYGLLILQWCAVKSKMFRVKAV